MKSLILIALLSTGRIEWQPIEAETCTKAVDALQAGEVVAVDKVDGTRATIVQGICLPDTLALRIELEGGSQGACGEGV